MICRVWKGIAPAEKAEEYTRALRSIAEERCLSIPGIEGIVALKREKRGLCELLFLTVLSSSESTAEMNEQEMRAVIPGSAGPQNLQKANRSVDYYDVIIKSEKNQARLSGFYNETSPIGIIW